MNTDFLFTSNDKKFYSTEIICIKNIINLIDKAELTPEFSNDSDQKKLLEGTKVFLKESILGCLVAAERYVEIIGKQKIYLRDGKDKDDPEVFRKESEAIDSSRTLVHNALMSQINIINRTLNQFFGILSENEISILRRNKQKQFLEVNRINLPPNGILPAGVDCNYRKTVTVWAMNLIEQLTANNN